MYRIGCLFDELAHLFVDLSAVKAIFSIIKADLFCTPKISFADSANSQSLIPGYNPPKSIQCPDKNDRHRWDVEKRYL